jgi:integrase/recombinase XerD
MKVRDLIAVYLKYLKTLDRPYNTIKGAKYGVKTLVGFLEAQNVHHIEDITADILNEYQEELSFRLTAKGTPLSVVTREKLLVVARCFTRFLKEKDYLLHDPGELIKLPKPPRRLPKVILSSREIKKLLSAPDMQTNRGRRDRVILEILYDTAIRRAEMADIKLCDLDLEAGYIRIHGKGNKDRVVPVSERVCELVRQYILFVRPSFIKQDDPGYLILNRSGNKMVANGIYVVVKSCVGLAGIKKNVSTHSLRHTCATHMLKNGAPVRHIQEMLGHESLESTQIYTHVTINDLKAIHAKYHPSESLQNRPK